MEAFVVFLDEVHHACTHMSVVAGEATPKEGRGWTSTFPRADLRRKVELLRERYDVGFPDVVMLLSVQKFRNCLSHRRGVVGPEECSEEGVFTVVWPGVELVARSPGGTETVISCPLAEPFVTAAGASLSIRIGRKTAKFGLGDKVQLSHTQVNEVCWFLQSAAGQVCKSAQTYAGRLGFEFSE